MSTLISYTELKKKLGGNTPEGVIANLEHMGIRYKCRLDGKPITTLDAINRAIGLRQRTPDDDTNKQTVEVEV
ncbi:hypothetical protein VSS37_03965 [Candidatus Thiothrix sp. Deng01]|uniref:DUF4224 domain-containing protein n=1 Tax=Candidatus Thiothrix phosphatis TaxID=3112415 RepID=A0ABU6CTJ5_9GAMM|nr:hypothetical protein [Candidatus Thiothrix sp. Deng01]MEB4590128.1 hypothetical protein [Candidatus Thiothrix sp. Deng01]